MAQHNISINDSTGSDDEWSKLILKQIYAGLVFVWVLSVIEIPLMILTLIGLCFLIKSRPAASVFVSHLILSDLIQVICLLKAAAKSWTIYYMICKSSAYPYSLIVGLYFMACVAFERYLLVSHPVWYQSHHSLKLSCFISVIVWFVPLTCAEIDPPHIYFNALPVCIVFNSLPHNQSLFCWHLARSFSFNITDCSQAQINFGQFVPGAADLHISHSAFSDYGIVDFVQNYSFVMKFYYYTHLLVFVNPLADCVLYLFMRPDVGDLMKSVHCCCRHQSWKHNQDEHSVVNPQNSCTALVCCISAQKPASHSMNTRSSV